MRYQSKPQYSEFLMPPEETFKAKPVEQRQTTPQKEDKKEAEFQYNIELVCSSSEVKYYKIKSFLLASTDQETTANTSWAESPNQDSTGIILTTSVYVNEPKALHYQFAGTKSTALSYENVKPVKKGDLSHTESFIPVKPSVQIGERLGWPTEGYFYHFIDDEFVHEYKIQGDDRWAFSATESTKESLSDSLLSSQLTTILLPWKINGKTIGRQHLLFKKEKITKELLDNEINPDWLDEHACLLNMRDIAATRTVPILDTEKQEGDNIIYVVKAGDTLSKIANRHGITLNKLIELNPKYKENPNAINVGEKVTIETKQEATPQLEFHVCQIDSETNQRETWSQIAAKYSLAPKELLELNKHYDSDPTALAVGDKLNVKTKSQDITTPEKRNTLPAEDVTTDKTVYAFSNAQCTASDKTHFNVLPIIDLGQADKNTPVIKTNKVVLKSKLLSNSDALELLAKDKGTLIKKGSKGPEVKAIQEALLAMKIDIGSSTSDEVFGNNTYNAIKQFQETFVIKNTIHPEYKIGDPDGIIGKNTLLAMDEALVSRWVYENTKEILTFPNTSFKYQRTKTSLKECLDTLPQELRPQFRHDITIIIEKMHKLGIALGAPNKYKAGYRTFKQQYDLPSNVTKAGPGESFHNYGLAVDLGIIDWVDQKGKNHFDFWLGTMDSMKEYKGFSSKIWKKRNKFLGSNVHDLSWEIIHLQAVPASTSGRSSLVSCLNKAAELSALTYRRGRTNTYECKLSSSTQWVNIGSAKDLWDGSIKNVDDKNKKIIIDHMRTAEVIAKTITL